ncbi:hypothetical protein FJ365_00375 [Candidatus Dependentiae bacterium]|nr:hypothetical protein [Candidatus Dependentiae bacterium]
MKTYLASVAYTVLQIITLPFTLLLLFAVHRQRRRKDNSYERMGFVKKSPPNRPVLWFHAVSAGEVLSLQEMIATIKREQPEQWCYLTVGTPVGLAMAQKNIPADTISYLPYDFLPSMCLAYARIRPQAVIVIESELWPHLFFIAKWLNKPLFLLNARVSKRSEKRMHVLAPLVRLLLNCCHAILTQSEADTRRFITLGAPPLKVHTLGNIKAFNVFQKRKQLPNHLVPQSGCILLVGSIHPTEDKVFLELFCQLKTIFPSLKLILVPRHFHWQNTLIAHARATTYKVAEWTSLNAHQTIDALLSIADIVIVCRFGELFKLYQYATLFFLGGTFVQVGGHNLLEPAAWGIPALVGPYHANCISTFTALEEKGAAKAVTSVDNLLITTTNLLKNPGQIDAMSTANIKWIKKEAHRVEHTMRLVLFSALFSR